MEELKILVDMVAGLPNMALWVIAAFWAYKVVVIGSVYGVIRLAINKTHSWLTTPKHELVTKEVRGELEGITLDGVVLNELIRQIKRLKKDGLCYIHSSDVDMLRDALDSKLKVEKKPV